MEVQVSRTDGYDDVTRKAKEVVGLNGYEGGELHCLGPMGHLFPTRKLTIKSGVWETTLKVFAKQLPK